MELVRDHGSVLTSDRQALATPSESLRCPVGDDTFFGERQDIIDPEAAILVAGQMTETPRFCPPAVGRRLVGSPNRSPVGPSLNPGSTAVPPTFGL